ncbi:hypothetical protein GF345_05525 [Candidatus Woesearchaeota archaeon]|nr:hypothetical protein [Candidatus Woesearchaeota archaeon]
MPTARCMKCRTQVEIKDPEEVILKNGLKSLKGVCPNCGTKVSRILGKASEEEIKAKQAEQESEEKEAA